MCLYYTNSPPRIAEGFSRFGWIIRKGGKEAHCVSGGSGQPYNRGEDVTLPSQTFSCFFERHKTRLALAVLLFSAALLIYPFLSDWLYFRSSSAVISSYSEGTEKKDAETKKKLLDDAQEYNETLNKSRIQLTDPFEAASMDEMNEL